MVNTAARPTVSSRPDLNRRIWFAGIVVAVLGAISALLAFWPAAHLPESILGLVALPIAGWAQLISESTNQRWLIICGAVAAGFGLALGMAHGGFVP